MWLDGFGKILDDGVGPGERLVVLQIPGDLKRVVNFQHFLTQVATLSDAVNIGRHDLVVGDFDLQHSLGAKNLIDMYGTYPLLFNWFPEVANKLLRDLEIKRPRSEFLAVSADFLRDMMGRRKFAYEQTVAFLIYALSEPKYEDRVAKHEIGVVEDYGDDKGFREAIDQIERTERVLKVLWREMNGGNWFDIGKFLELDRRSTAIREAAMVYLENVLNIQSPSVPAKGGH